MPVEILMMRGMAPIERLLERDYVLHILPASDAEPFLRNVGERIRGVVAYSGARPVDATIFAALPKLEIIANMGAGYESIDIETARKRGIVVTNAGGANAVDVAEHAFGLILAVGRGISEGDRYVRTGKWLERRMPMMRRVSGRKLGIVGLGNIGLEIAKRAVSFDMPVSYHNRRPREGAPYRYAPNLVDLARDVDFLAIATPGGAGTHHLVGRAVLDALGPDGVLVNVARGSVVDQAALIQALIEKRIAGAGLDVFEDEPNVPDTLIAMSNVVLQPHMAGATQEGVAAAVDLIGRNLRAHFAGQPVLTPVK